MPRPLPRLPRWLPRLLLACLLSSCAGPGFNRAWKNAGSLPNDGVCGRWEGTWLSDVNGHHGRLRCVVSPPAEPNGPHQFFYHATWMRVLSGSYRAGHLVKPAGRERWTFTGEHRLPSWAGGLYHYEGSIQNGRFEATYHCELDRGHYHLHRVAAKE